MSVELPNLSEHQLQQASVIRTRKGMYLPADGPWRAWRALLELSLLGQSPQCGDVVLEVTNSERLKMGVSSGPVPKGSGSFLETLAENWVGGGWNLPHGCWRGGAYLPVLNQFSKTLNIRANEPDEAHSLAYESGERVETNAAEASREVDGLEIVASLEQELVWPEGPDTLLRLVADFAGFYETPVVCKVDEVRRDYCFSSVCELFTERTQAEPDRFLVTERDECLVALVGTKDRIRDDAVFINGFAAQDWQLDWIRPSLGRQNKGTAGTMWLLFRGDPSGYVGATGDYFVEESFEPVIEEMASHPWRTRSGFDQAW